MSKHPNPVRGYVPCPVCSSEATVHQVGEGRLIAEGEPPKNSRNLGLKYYKCPNCGNSSMSKSVDKYIEERFSMERIMVGQKLEALDSTEANALETVESVEPDAIAEPSDSKVESTELTERETEEKAPVSKSFFSFKRVLTALGVLIVLLWAFRLLMPKPQPEEVANAATE
ncbi:hypothetical protein [Vibrio sinaloensis]|uniref:Uncharacterized protein n=1 Tax=Photobacterium sp. (strain ATCC 43367) TaxID=379097 RepID=A0A0A5HTQ5_PHOS4|nr:hypothetical protein [Vibrio sinaloensis]KGY07700.1 hypothetical protein NM06_15860 [Vibrio sinaloensis]